MKLYYGFIYDGFIFIHTLEIVDMETAESTCDFADLKSMEGTVLLYVSNTLRQNHALGKGIMKLMKVPANIFYDRISVKQQFP